MAAEGEEALGASAFRKAARRLRVELPRAGRTVAFDRSGYGRVLLERVEGLAKERDWRRAYGEIRHFEAQLVEHGALVLKPWLHVDADAFERALARRPRG